MRRKSHEGDTCCENDIKQYEDEIFSLQVFIEKYDIL